MSDFYELEKPASLESFKTPGFH